MAEKNVKQPNRRKKYKTLYYVLQWCGVLMIIFSIFGFCVWNYAEQIVMTMVEGVDYYTENVQITDKQHIVKKETVHFPSYPFLYRTYDSYYLYSYDTKIWTDDVTYNQTNIDNWVTVYISSKEHAFTNEITARNDCLADWVQNIIIGSVFAAVFGVFFTIYMFVFRKDMRNPYYSNW